MDLDFVTVVTGLPRSGTSVMMQILEAGGMEILTDNVRTSDEDNPKGYYEFEAVKQTKKDPSWVADAAGKAVKMVYRLLYEMPKEYEYRVIFTRRNMDEVLQSQKIMLERTGNNEQGISDEKFAEMFKKDLEKIDEWIKGQDNISVISVNYKDVIETPQEQCERINEFLGGVLDVEKMPLVVDASLYRNRK
ncbi:MAG: sulfotransferase domain-containing protein [Planctomycetota bacterium]|jgi:hypothetical protein